MGQRSEVKVKSSARKRTTVCSDQSEVRWGVRFDGTRQQLTWGIFSLSISTQNFVSRTDNVGNTPASNCWLTIRGRCKNVCCAFPMCWVNWQTHSGVFIPSLAIPGVEGAETTWRACKRLVHTARTAHSSGDWVKINRNKPITVGQSNNNQPTTNRAAL